jgi:hypothetical protein
MMKKILIALVVIFALVIAYVPGATAEMAKEGEGNYTSGMSSAYKMLSTGRERIEMQFDVNGVVTEAPENSPLYNTTFCALGALHAVKGTYKETGFVRYTRPNGDQIFATYEANGNLAGERTLKTTFVRGTGKCAGITGGGEFSGIPGLKNTQKGIIMGISVGKFHWKIP